MIEFVRCFVIGSISGFVLRRYSSSNAISEFINAYETFFDSNHNQGKTVRTTCIDIILQTSKKVREKIPAHSRMGKEICNTTLYGMESYSSLKKLVAAAVSLLSNALQVCSNFFYKIWRCSK